MVRFMDKPTNLPTHLRPYLPTYRPTVLLADLYLPTYGQSKWQKQFHCLIKDKYKTWCCMSKLPVLYSKLLIEMGHWFLDRRFFNLTNGNMSRHGTWHCHWGTLSQFYSQIALMSILFFLLLFFHRKKNLIYNLRILEWVNLTWFRSFLL